MKPATRAITVDATIGAADPLEIVSGPSIVPTERMKLFSPSDWEGLVDEWASSLGQYGLVERTSGAGDMGCDVIGTVDPSDLASPWDNYQDEALIEADAECMRRHRLPKVFDAGGAVFRHELFSATAGY